MRITIAQGAFFPVPPLRGGAVEKVWQALGRELARRGHTITHISRLCDGLLKNETLKGVHHLRVPGFDVPSSMIRLKWRDFLYSRRVLSVLPPADIFVTNTFFLPLLSRDRSRGQLYVHVARFPKGQLRYYKNAARLQCVSEAVAEAAREQCTALKSRVMTLPNPLPDNTWVANPPQNAERPPMVLYAGRIHPEKGLDLLAKAWAHPRVRTALAGWKLVLAGPWEVAQGGGGEEYKAALVQQLNQVVGSVEWTGPLFGPDSAKLSALYQQARIFVYASVADRGESFGLAPLEAMAAGTPCIVSNLACFKDFLRHDENGLIFDHHAPDPVGQLVEALVGLANNTDQRNRLAAAAWQTAGHYRVEEVATRYENDFELLLNQRTP